MIKYGFMAFLCLAALGFVLKILGGIFYCLYYVYTVFGFVILLPIHIICCRFGIKTYLPGIPRRLWYYEEIRKAEKQAEREQEDREWREQQEREWERYRAWEEEHRQQAENERYSQQPQEDFTEKDPFEILGLSRPSSKPEIISAYREKMKLNHPDRASGLDPEIQAFASERAKIINWAYEEALRAAG